MNFMNLMKKKFWSMLNNWGWIWKRTRTSSGLHGRVSSANCLTTGVPARQPTGTSSSSTSRLRRASGITLVTTNGWNYTPKKRRRKRKRTPFLLRNLTPLKTQRKSKVS